MSELDEAWAAALATAAERARAAGRADLTEYLTLRRANDLARTIAKDWLLDSFALLAGEAKIAGADIQIDRAEEHRFKIGNASMVGSCLNLRKGVRAILVEVGWPRVPRDGFIKGGGLALGHIRHQGIKIADEKLRLLTDPHRPPRWLVENSHGDLTREIHEADLRHHIAVFLDHSPKPKHS